MNRGSNALARSLGSRQTASMRPRFMNRGSLEGAEREQLRIEVASMRPRFMNRGSNDIFFKQRTRIIELQ